jgi:transcription antitermination protein NusB
MMPLPPQKFREAVFQILYSHDFDAGNEEEMVPFMMQELKTTRRAMVDAHSRMGLVLASLSEIDPLIAAGSTEYVFERISRVERTLLRLGIFEILFDDSIPPKVAIAEAVRLCRKFGTPESAQFVNAILDRVYKKNAPPPAAESVLI